MGIIASSDASTFVSAAPAGYRTYKVLVLDPLRIVGLVLLTLLLQYLPLGRDELTPLEKQ